MSQPSPIDQAAYVLSAAKKAEDAARNHRIQCEQALIALTGLKDEGSQTVNSTYYKVTVTQTLNRTLKDDYLARMDGVSLDTLSYLVSSKPVLNVKTLKALEKHDPEQYAIAIQGIVTKPAKPSVPVELISAQQEAA